MIVDLPAPEGPTRAVAVPGGTAKLMSFRTGSPERYSKHTFSNAMWPFTSSGFRGEGGRASAPVTASRGSARMA